MAEKITTTKASKKIMPTLGEALKSAAFAQAEEFVSAGQSVRESTSLVAGLMIEAAWIVAGCGVVSEGGTPDKEKFRSAVEAALANIAFKPADEKVGA